MSPVRILGSAFLSLIFTFSLAAQQSTPASQAVVAPQGAPLLRQSLAALVGAQSITDITLTATARRIAGSDDETGTATLQAIASGASRVELHFPSGPRIETLNLSSEQPSGSWSGPDGAAHPIAYHNLLTGSAVFFPALAISSGLAPATNQNLGKSAAIATHLGRETKNGQSVEHLSLSQPSPFASAPGALSFEHLSQLDFFQDSTTLLPIAVAFNIHPDNNALLDIPVEIHFSDYRPVNGAQIPFHIQKFINNSLTLDLQIQSATLNSGISASLFAVQ